MTDLRTEEVVLANGGRALLNEVAGTLILIDHLLDSNSEDRDLVLDLRAACLSGKPVASPSAVGLAKFSVLDDDGTVVPVVRDVVLAAVRGEGRALFTVSPFTTTADRVVADLVASRLKALAILPPDQLEVIDPKVSVSTDPWADRIRKGKDGGLGSAPSPN